MRTPIAAAAAALFIAVLSTDPCSAQEQPTRWQGAGPAAAKLADRARAAVAAGDAADLAAVASSAQEDPVRVVFELHARFVRAALADPAGGREDLAAARALATASVPKRALPALAEACDAWSSAKRADLEREARLLDVFPVVKAAAAKGDPAAIAAAVDAAGADLRAGPPSPAAAVLLHDRADALAALSRIREAIPAFREVLDRHTAIGWLRGRGLALRWSGTISADAGDLERAREMLEAEIRQWTEMGQPIDAWGGRVNRGVLLARSGYMLAARDQLLACVEEGDRFGMPRARAFARSQLGQFWLRMGQVDDARTLLEESRVLFLESAMPARAAGASLGIVSCDAAAGRFAEALAGVDRCLSMAERSGSPLARARVLGTRARVLDSMGDHAAAVEAAARSETLLREIGASLDEAHSALDRADALGGQSRWKEAAAAAARAREIAESAGTGEILRRALVTLAEARMGQGDYDGAAKECRAVLELAQGERDPLIGARCRIDLALCLARSGRAAEARATLEQAAAGVEALVDTSLRVRRGLAGAEIALRAGDPAAAAAAARNALDVVVAMVPGLGDEEAAGVLGRGREASDAGIEACLRRGPGAGEDALAFLEGNRAVLLARLLRGRQAIHSSSLPRELVDARRTATLRLREASARLVAAVARGEEAPVAAARKEFDAAEQEWRTLCARTQRESRRAAAVDGAPASGLARIRAAIPADAALVLFHLGGPSAGSPGRAAAVVVRGEGAPVLVDLGESAPLGERAATWTRRVATEGGDEPAMAAALYDALLRPLEPAVAGARRLLVSPDGLLQFLPFEALLRADGDRRERAVERWEFSFVPSGTVLAGLVEEARGSEPGAGLVALADPRYPSEPADGAARPAVKGAAPLQDVAGLRRLRESGDEARAVASYFPDGSSVLLLREGATRSGLEAACRSAGGRLAAVHLACHGILDPEHPGLTGLVLSGGEVLSLYDVYEMPVAADLTVLSACHTAGGRLVSGEGVLGLVRGFFFAGCPRVVASSWEVPDRGTRVFMEALYRGWRREGLAPAAALRAAKLAALRGGGEGADPSRWAAFVFWGHPDR